MATFANLVSVMGAHFEIVETQRHKGKSEKTLEFFFNAKAQSGPAGLRKEKPASGFHPLRLCAFALNFFFFFVPLRRKYASIPDALRAWLRA